MSDNNNNKTKLTQLQAATAASAEQLDLARATATSAAQRLQTAKALLREMDPTDAARIQVSDTALPELIAQAQLAQDALEVAQKRHDTNQRYLTLMQQKAAAQGGES